MTYGSYEKVEFNDSEILITEIEGDQQATLKINYLFEDNIAKFNMNLLPADLGIDTSGELGEDVALEMFGLILESQGIMILSYLAAAETVGIDVELANSYYQQVYLDADTSDDVKTVECDVFKYYQNNEDINCIESSMEVNLEELKKLNEASLTKDIRSTITIVENSDIKDDTANNTVDNTVNNTVNNTVDNDVNNTMNNTVDNDVNNTMNNTVSNNIENDNKLTNNTITNISNNKIQDNTTTNEKLPDTGSKIIQHFIIILIVFSLGLYIKIRNYDN